MRTLTIKREKRFVGCLVKMKVYIEDPAGNELMIQDIPCRKLGELKNGETGTFSIGEEAAKIFVIADKISKNYCNEFYEISAGQEDVFLSGKNRFNPATGNAFRFNGAATVDMMRSRRKGMYRGSIILCAAIAIGIVGGVFIGIHVFSKEKTASKAFSADGMRITLTEDFTSASVDGYTACYDSQDVAILVIKENFSLLDGLEEYSLDQYGNSVLQRNQLSSAELKHDNGLTYFEYDYVIQNDTYYYFSVVYKADDAFWFMQFVTLKDNAERYSDKLIQWAKSVQFSDEQ